MHARLSTDLLAAIRAIGDDALGDPIATPMTETPGSNRRPIRIECQGAIHAIFSTMVVCEPGDRNARYGPIEIVVSRGGRTARGPFEGLGARQPESDEGRIDTEALKERLHDLVRQL
jgi:hypothetical protein